MIKVDGISWPVACEVHRKPDVRISDISGLMLTKAIFNDVLGTYANYSVAIPVPRGNEAEYAALFEILSNPVEGHTFELPYNSGNIAVVGIVSGLTDTPYLTPSGYYWEGCRFEITANYPSKTMSLGQAISRGRTPIPAQTTYEDADERYY